MSQTDYEAVLPEMEARPADYAKSPHMPVHYFVQGSITQERRVALHADAFEAVNFPSEMVGKIVQLAQALRHAESICEVHFPDEATKRAWEEALDRSYYVRTRLISALEYTVGHDETAQAKLREIRQGNGHADSIQDLSDLKVMGEKHQQELNQANFDMALIEEAGQLARQMSTLLADATINREGSGPHYVMRNKIMTALKEITDRVEACARYIWPFDPEIANSFAVRYQPRFRAKKAGEQQPVAS